MIILALRLETMFFTARETIRVYERFDEIIMCYPASREFYLEIARVIFCLVCSCMVSPLFTFHAQEATYLPFGPVKSYGTGIKLFNRCFWIIPLTVETYLSCAPSSNHIIDKKD